MRDQDPSFQTLDPVDCLSCSVKREIRLSYQNIAETLRGCVLNSPYPSNPSDLEICFV